MNEIGIWRIGQMKLGARTEVLEENRVAVPPYPPHLRRTTACAMPSPTDQYKIGLLFHCKDSQNNLRHYKTSETLKTDS